MGITNEKLISWFNERSVWLRDAVRTYYENGIFTDKDILRFADECIQEAAGKKTSKDFLAGLNLLSRDDKESFSIKKISNVEGVNALASSKELEFGANGVTVIYGENGAGKSGYIRILKKLADAKYKEPLKENVYTTSKNKQSCEVTIECGGSEKLYRCDLKKDGEHSIFKDIDIFDTCISTAYINDAKEASFEPWVFSLFREIAAIATKVKDEIEKQEKALDPSEIIIPDGLENTSVGKAILGITDKTSFVDTFFQWDKKDEELLETKQKEANIESINSSIEKLRKEIKQTSELLAYFKQFEQFFSHGSISDIEESKKTWQKAKEKQKAAQVLFSKSASDLDKESISNQSWISLWKDAHHYYEELLESKGVIHYASEHGYCPLCGQEINETKLVHRMKSVDDFINGNISKTVDETSKEYIKLLRRIPKAWDVANVQIIVDACGLEDDKKIVECAGQIYGISTVINSNAPDTVDMTLVDICTIVDLLEAAKSSKETEKSKYEELLHDEEHKRLIDEINEMNARKFISKQKNKVFDRIAYMKAIKQYNQASKLTATRVLTTKSNELGQEIIADDYIKRFNDELKVLTKGAVRASLRQQRATKGRTPFKIVLDGVQDDKANPEDVFSEGEKRVVSLAAFFAESSGRRTECPLIVDDPISSLDVKYEELVIKRLIEASKYRQVIVFTHRLSMVVGLCDGCKQSIPFEEVELVGRGETKGVPSKSSGHGKKAKGKLQKLKDENLPRLRKLDENTDDYVQGLHYVCQQIRNLVEKSVEETLLYGIVLRYRHSIQTKNKISWLSCISNEDCQMIDSMMTKYSYYDHSMSDETPLQEFSINEIERDLEALINWIKNVQKRQEKL